MTHITQTCEAGDMNDEAKDRLRLARERLGLTRARLAAKIGKAESTIRAHENGQNNIQPDMAATYARELGVTPSWLLYGEGEIVPAPTGTIAGAMALRPIRIVGEIWVDRDAFHREGEEPEVFRGSLLVSLPEYEDRELSAYLLRGGADESLVRSYVIIANVVEPLSLVDTVVLKMSEGKFYSIDTWRVGAEKDWIVFYQGDTQSKAHEVIKIRELEDKTLQVLGVVVAELSIRRRIDYAPIGGQEDLFDFNTAGPQIEHDS